MPIMRITGSQTDENGVQVGEAKVQDVVIESVVSREEDRQNALLAEAQRNREVANYLNLSRPPTREPITAQEAEMAENEKERTQVNTSGSRFEEMAKQQEEKLKVENVQTVHAGVAKTGTGTEQKLIPTAEVYTKEQDQRSEGVPVEDINPLTIAPPLGGTVGGNRMDEAEAKLRTAQLPDEHSVQHATGSSDPAAALVAKQTGALDEVAGDPKTDEEIAKESDKGHQAAAKASGQEKEGEPSQASQASSGDFSGSAQELEQNYSADDLRQEAERRGVEVKRGDGKDGAPLKSDYAKALAKK